MARKRGGTKGKTCKRFKKVKVKGHTAKRCASFGAKKKKKGGKRKGRRRKRR
jgi:hypothetical protein